MEEEPAMARWKTLEEFEIELLPDKSFKKEFEGLEPEHQIARTILSARQATGMSQQDLAKVIGTSQSRISLWERAEEIPRWDTLKKIANATGVSFQVGIQPSGRQAGGKKAQRAGRKKAGKQTTRKVAARKSGARRKSVTRGSASGRGRRRSA